ncbi:MAG: DUF448 domain-containing protein [Deltaproteobacteria bacterium]|nr:DUF448 domain-containing protein [Deltaproteobacteria bacterium]
MNNAAPKTRRAGHSPVRMCVVCRKRFLKAELLRYTGNARDGGTADPGRTRPGRGFYVCADARCAAKLRQRRAHCKGGSRE